MIENLTCTAFQWHIQGHTLDWEALDVVVRHRCVPGPDQSTTDVTYQVQFKSAAATSAQFDVTYRVELSDSKAGNDLVQDTTWPYLRVEVLTRLTPLGAPPHLLPVLNPVRETPHDAPLPVETPSPTTHPTKPVLLPEPLATELRLSAALAKLTSTGERWLQPALHLYSAFVHLERRRSQTAQELEIVNLLFQTEAGCTLERVLALSPAARRRLRGQARQLIIAAIHAVMERRADTNTGDLENAFERGVEELFSSEGDANAEPQTPLTAPYHIRDAAMQILELTHREVRHYQHHSGHLFSMQTPLGSTIVTYATGYDFAVDNRLENAGHTRHLIDLHVAGTVPHSSTPVTLSLREDVSDEFERWADEYDLLSHSPEDQKRLRHVRALNASSSPIPTRTLNDLGVWAAGFTDENAINDAMLSLPLTPADLLEAAGLPGIHMWTVVKHPNCTAEVLEILARHPDEDVRADVAACSGTPSELLFQLYQDSSRVRQSLGTNRNLPEELLQLLIHNADDLVRACVAVNPALRREWLEVLADDPFSGTRENLAQNPSIPDDLLLKLLHDPDEHVRGSAGVTAAERGQQGPPSSSV